MKLSWVQTAVLYNVASNKLAWDGIRGSYKAPLTPKALIRLGLLKQDRDGWYDLTENGIEWVKANPPPADLGYEIKFLNDQESA